MDGRVDGGTTVLKNVYIWAPTCHPHRAETNPALSTVNR
jgi:hypothetical protein